ncbi:MAG TPA: heavy metal sensor histidine kinase [Verrucomicrobiae bacterium]|nr:heavy metal sensor histidine kinase [Verrucomicrobiae bacterium]
MILKSIKWRLQAWHGFLLICLVSGLMIGFYTYQQRARLQAVDNELREKLTLLLPRVAPPGGRGDGERRRRPPPDELRFDGPADFSPRERNFESGAFEATGFYYIARSQEGRRSSSTNAPQDIPFPEFKARQGTTLRTRGEFRELIHAVPTGTRVLVGTSLATALAELHQLAATLTVIGLGIVVTGSAVGWWLAVRALRPINEISNAAVKIAAGDLSKRINTSETESELGQLATVLNSTFARLETAFAQQQQFTSDAAHELRTPVSVIVTQTQSTLTRERTPQEYRETLEACQRAAQRMRRLIESLLELARFDTGQETLRRAPFDLANTARDSVELLRPLARLREIAIHGELSPCEMLGDSERLGQVVTNLLSNAINHNKEGGEIRISTRWETRTAVLTVSDNGPGITPEHLPRIFERFYRADAARTSTQGRSGLGLAISKAIVEAHGGSIDVQSRVGIGSTFTVRLPLATRPES